MNYKVRILVHGYGEGGRNPEFDFNNWEKLHSFIDVCFENGYDVEIAKLELDDE